ncbi:hypothetical protein LXA43DRAFT_905390, partial [Ganoderma leucocontextum]
MIADAMDLPSLIHWKATCRTAYAQAVSSQRRSLSRLIAPFVPNPHILIDLLPQFRAFLGGEVALAFLLRDPNFHPTAIDIFCNIFQFDTLCSALLHHSTLRTLIEHHEIVNHPSSFFSPREVVQYLHIRFVNGRSIYVHRSTSISASSPVIRAPNTGLMNYVTPYGFASAYPVLTLDRKAIISDLTLATMTTRDQAMVDNMLRAGFSLAVSPCAW